MVLLLAVSHGSTQAQVNPGRRGAQDPPKVNQGRVDGAIAKGIAYLKGRGEYGVRKSRRDELVLLTLLHAGFDQNDPKFQELFKSRSAQIMSGQDVLLPRCLGIAVPWTDVLTDVTAENPVTHQGAQFMRYRIFGFNW